MATKRVTLLVHGHGREFFPGGKERIDVEVDGALSINEILDHIGVNRSLVMSAFSGGVRRDRDYVPADGEELVLVSPPSGG